MDTVGMDKLSSRGCCAGRAGLRAPPHRWVHIQTGLDSSVRSRTGTPEDAVAMYKLNTIAKPLQNVHSHSRSAAAAAAVHAAARHQRPLRPLPMAETGVWGPCVLPTHVRSTAASTVDADIMLSMTSAVARHCISPRCWCAPTAGLVQLVARRAHSHDGTECARGDGSPP